MYRPLVIRRMSMFVLLCCITDVVSANAFPIVWNGQFNSVLVVV